MKRFLLVLICSLVLASCKTTDKPSSSKIEDERHQKIEQLEKTDEYVPWWLKENGQNN